MANQMPALTKDYLIKSIEQLFQGSSDKGSEAIGIELEIFPFSYNADQHDALIDVENKEKSDD